MTENRIEYHSHGDPLEVLQFASHPLETTPPGQVRVRLLYANINPSDFGMIAGTYGRLPTLPAVAGREGLGVIDHIPEGTATPLKLGDRVRMPESDGAWRTHVNCDPEPLIRVPSDIPAEQAATFFINPPTALLLLESFGNLQPGDWVIQNAANSAVGAWVIQLCRVRGIHTINVVRRKSLEPELKALGADVVVEDDDAYLKALSPITGGKKPTLALNSVGGASVTRLIRSLADGGTCVTFGGMVGDPQRFPTRNLIFNDVHLCGFWMDRWTRTHSQGEIQALYDRLFALASTHNLKSPVAGIWNLADFKEAIKAAKNPRMGKTLLQAS